MTTAYTSTSTSPWVEAVATHAHLAAGGRIRSMPAPFPFLVPARDEEVLGVFDGGITYARYCAAEAPQVGGGPTMVWGSAPFVAGYVATGALLQGRARRKVRKHCAPQWRSSVLLRTVLTTHRLWVEIRTAEGSTWLHLNYETITGFALNGATLTVAYVDANDLALSGEWVPWIAAVIAHRRYGANAAGAVPALHNANWAR